MSYNDQPQGFLSLYHNSYKQQPKQPDFKGSILIPFDLVNIISDDPNSVVELKNGTKCLKLDVSGWVTEDEDEAIRNKKPIVSGKLSQYRKYEKKTDSEPAPEKKQGLKKKLT